MKNDGNESWVSIITKFANVHKKEKKVCIAVYGLETHQSYGASAAIWDHTVLHATRHR